MVFAGKVGFDGKKFGNTKLTSIYKLNQEYAGQKSQLVALTIQNSKPLISFLSELDGIRVNTDIERKMLGSGVSLDTPNSL